MVQNNNINVDAIIPIQQKPQIVNTIPRDTHWCAAPVAAGTLRRWLTDRGSLTARLERHAGPIKVKVLFQGLRRVNRDEFRQDLPAILAAMDQPSIDGINGWFVSKASREQGLKVAISGLGGDELFGGYPSFQDLPRWQKYSRLPGSIPLLGKSLRTLLAPIMSRTGISPKAAGSGQFGGIWAGASHLKCG